MDPPSFKAARKKDRDLLEKLKDDDLKEFTDLEEKIEKGLEERRAKVRGPYASFSKESSPSNSDSAASGSDTDTEKEMEETNKFIQEETLNVIGECLAPTGAKLDLNASQATSARLDSLLMPPPTSTPSRSRMATSPVPCSPGLGLKETVEEYLAATVKEGGEGEGEDKKEGEEEDEELDLTGIDDDE